MKYKTTLVGCRENISSMKVGFFNPFFLLPLYYRTSNGIWNIVDDQWIFVEWRMQHEVEEAGMEQMMKDLVVR